MADNSIVLKVNNLSKSFGGIKAVQNVDFELKTNEIYGIIGPNGAGKSTIFNLITGYYKPDSGSVIFDGKQLVGLTPDRVCLLGITRTFQIARPFGNLTVFDNVMIGLLCKSKTVQDARINCGKILERTKLSHKARSLGSDLTTLERKRLEVARALATKPKILLLDEVMTGLKPNEMDEMMSLVLELKKQISIVVVEHVMRVVMRICDRIMAMEQGRKIAEGSPDEIANDKKVIEAYLGRGQGVAEN